MNLIHRWIRLLLQILILFCFQFDNLFFWGTTHFVYQVVCVVTQKTKPWNMVVGQLYVLVTFMFFNSVEFRKQAMWMDITNLCHSVFCLCHRPHHWINAGMHVTVGMGGYTILLIQSFRVEKILACIIMLANQIYLFAYFAKELRKKISWRKPR